MKKFFLSVIFCSTVFSMENYSQFLSFPPINKILEDRLGNVKENLEKAKESFKDLKAGIDLLTISKNNNSSLFKSVSLESDFFKEELNLIKATATFSEKKVTGTEENYQALMNFYKNVENLIKAEKFNLVETINIFEASPAVLAKSVSDQFINFLHNKSLDNHPSYTILENYIKKSLEKKGNDALKDIFFSLKKNFLDLKNIISEDFSFLNEKDIVKIFECFLTNKEEFLEKNLIEEYVKRDLTRLKNFFSDKTVEVYKKTKNEDYVEVLNKNAFGPAHIVLGSPGYERDENIETYNKNLKEFELKIKNFNLQLNPKIKSSLYSLTKDGDIKLRGFYSDIIITNTSEEDLRVVVEALNNIEGCEDCARLFAYQLQGLNKNIKKDIFEPGSLEDLYENIHAKLFQKRNNVFEKLMKDISGKERWKINGENYVYAFGKIRSYFQDLFGLGKTSYKKSSHYEDVGEEYTYQQKKRSLIADFYKEYNEEVIYKIVEESIGSNKEYEKSMIRFVGMEEITKGIKIVPSYNEEQSIFESNIHMSSKGKPKEETLKKILELFGFNKIMA